MHSLCNNKFAQNFLKITNTQAELEQKINYLYCGIRHLMLRYCRFLKKYRQWIANVSFSSSYQRDVLTWFMEGLCRSEIPLPASYLMREVVRRFVLWLCSDFVLSKFFCFSALFACLGLKFVKNSFKRLRTYMMKNGKFGRLSNTVVSLTFTLASTININVLFDFCWAIHASSMHFDKNNRAKSSAGVGKIIVWWDFIVITQYFTEISAICNLSSISCSNIRELHPTHYSTSWSGNHFLKGKRSLSPNAHPIENLWPSLRPTVKCRIPCFSKPMTGYMTIKANHQNY